MSKTAPSQLPSELLLVLGPHRSGSSAMTRSLSLLGYELPKTLIKDNSSNRRGHWESQPVARRNETYMQDADLVWTDWVAGNLPKVPAARQKEFQTDIRAIVADEFKPGVPGVLKDPRLCRLVPQYRAALEGETTLKAVITLRNPLDVMQSLVARNTLTEGHAALLWLSYTLDAVQASEGLPRAFVSYDAMLSDPVATFAAAEKALGGKFPNKIAFVSSDIGDFLNTKFRHQQSSNEDLMHNDLTRGMISDSYDALRLLTQDPGDKKALKTLADLHDQLIKSEPILGHVLSSYGIDLTEMERRKASASAAAELRREQVVALREHHKALQREVKRLRTRNSELEGEVDAHLNAYLAVTNSRIWRLTRPLRGLVSRLRARSATRGGTTLPRTPERADGDDDKPRPVVQVDPSHVERLRSSSIFDAAYYLARHPEARRHPNGPAGHYLSAGWQQWFDPAANFNTQAYEHSHADLMFNDQCPALHFLDTYADIYAKIADPTDRAPRIAVFSAVTGGYDDIKEPAFPVDDVDFFMFTDGAVPAGSVWQKRDLEYVDADPTRSARFVKTHPHLYFAEYDYAIWMDANLALNAHPRDLLAMVDATKPIHSWKHPLRICVYDEADTCIELRKDDAGTMRADMDRLRAEGFPRHAGLIETSVIVTTMAHADVPDLYADWWARIERGSRRDQLSLPPAVRATGAEVGWIAPERICMRTDPRILYDRHIYNEREDLLQGQAA